MICPACAANALQEHSPACPRCGFSLGSLDQQLGIAPNLHAAVSDLANVLIPHEISQLEKHVHELGLRFPQCRFAVALVKTPAGVSLPVHAFWLFNKGGAAAPGETAGHCRLVLLLIDPEAPACNCMVGYGLEPFFRASELQRITHAARPYLQNRAFADGLHASLDQLDEQLHDLSIKLPQVFGLAEETAKTEADEELFAY